MEIQDLILGLIIGNKEDIVYGNTTGEYNILLGQIERLDGNITILMSHDEYENELEDKMVVTKEQLRNFLKVIHPDEYHYLNATHYNYDSPFGVKDVYKIQFGLFIPHELPNGSFAPFRQFLRTIEVDIEKEKECLPFLLSQL